MCLLFKWLYAIINLVCFATSQTLKLKILQKRVLMSWTSSEKIVLPLALAIIVIITTILSIILKNKSEKLKKTPFFILASLLLVMEIIKQVLSYPNYSLWSIPLHFCSTFMFWYALAAFTKGKVSELGFVVSVLFGFLFLALFYFNPSTIIGSSAENIFQNFSSFHTFVYHHVIILFTLLSITLKMFKPKLSQALPVSITYTIYAAIAILFANLLQVNFTNLLHSNIDFMQALLDKFGKIVYTAAMYLIGLFGLLAGLIASVYISKLNKQIKNKGKKIK